MATNLEMRAYAMALDNLRTILRSMAITADFFKGYSMGEAIMERMGRIGRLEKAKEVYEQGTKLSEKRLVTEYGYVTMQSQLLILKELALGADGKSGILKEVEELDTTVEDMANDDSFEPDSEDPNLLVSTLGL